jgi:hypothetical protein
MVPHNESATHRYATRRPTGSSKQCRGFTDMMRERSIVGCVLTAVKADAWGEWRPAARRLILALQLVGVLRLNCQLARLYIAHATGAVKHQISRHSTDSNRPVLAALPSQFATPIMCEVESLISDAPLRIRVDGLESRRSYAET